jgi:hypothetical protein
MNVSKHLYQDIIQSLACTHSQTSINKCMYDCALFGLLMCGMRQNRPPIRTKITGLMRHTLGALQQGMSAFYILFHFYSTHTCKKTLLLFLTPKNKVVKYRTKLSFFTNRKDNTCLPHKKYKLKCKK